MLASAAIGGLATSALALPYFKNELTKLGTKVEAMKESCLVCKAGVDKSVDTLAKDMKSHHEDDDKHNTKASERMLQDILERVVRIENRLFNGGSHLKNP